MEALMLILMFVGVLAFLGLVPGVRRFMLWALAFGFVGILILGTEMDDKSLRDGFLLFFGIPWALIFLIGVAQNFFIGYQRQQSEDQSLKVAVDRRLAERDRSHQASINAAYQAGLRQSRR